MSRQPLLDALQNLGKDPDDHIRELARRYQSVFNTGADSQLVLEDLKRKFWFYDSTAGEYVKENEGNRQVVLYILAMLGLDTTPPKIEDKENEN